MTARLLVVDDNPGYRRLVRLALEDDQAFDVVAEAGSAPEAIAVAADARPEVALVDVLLPEGQGFRLPAELRELVPGCTVVLTSAHSEGDIDAVRQLGGVAFLSKAIAPSRLGEELAAVVADLSPADDVLHHDAISLPGTPDSPRAARRFVEGVLERWECPSLVDTTTLLASELVANAVLHTASEVEVSLRLLPDRLRADVVDRSTALPHRRDAGDDEETGRGSDLVELLAAAWGISGRPDGKSVWFELALPPAVPS